MFCDILYMLIYMKIKTGYLYHIKDEYFDVDIYKTNLFYYLGRYGFCNTIIIRKIADEDAAILLQNAFPTLEKYIDHVHTVDGVPLNVQADLQNEIKSLFKNMIGLKKRGTNLFFTDIDNSK